MHQHRESGAFIVWPIFSQLGLLPSYRTTFFLLFFSLMFASRLNFFSDPSKLAQAKLEDFRFLAIVESPART